MNPPSSYEESENLLTFLLELDRAGLWSREANDLSSAGEAAAVDEEHPYHELAGGWIVGRESIDPTIARRAFAWVAEFAR